MLVPVSSIPSLPAKADHAGIRQKSGSPEFVSLMEEIADLRGVDLESHPFQPDQSMHPSSPQHEGDQGTDPHRTPKADDQLPLPPDAPEGPLLSATTWRFVPDPAPTLEGLAQHGVTNPAARHAPLQPEPRAATPHAASAALSPAARPEGDNPKLIPSDDQPAKTVPNLAESGTRNRAADAQAATALRPADADIRQDNPSTPRFTTPSPPASDARNSTPRPEAASSAKKAEPALISLNPQQTLPVAESSPPFTRHPRQVDHAQVAPRGGLDGKANEAENVFNIAKIVLQNPLPTDPPSAPIPSQGRSDGPSLPRAVDLFPPAPADLHPRTRPSPADTGQATPAPNALPLPSGVTEAQPPRSDAIPEELAQLAPLTNFPPPETKDTSARAAAPSVQTTVLAEAQRLALAVSDGPVVLTLSPEELGTLRFVVQQTELGLHLHLTVDQPATLDLLRRQGDQILSELRQSGFHNASFSFAGNDGQSGRHPQKDLPHPPSPLPDLFPITMSDQSRTPPKTGLSLYVRL
jgi:flagellar hook-length control protein FliK